MSDSVMLTAFMVGMISALSLPLGAATTFIWRPSDRMVAVLMAFGGGALLAALTIDLVGSALEEGHFHALAIGAIGGGIMFVVLNRLVNDYGGFLRKVSTTVYHLRRREHQRVKRIARQLQRVDIFADLPNREFRLLAASIRSIDVPQGQWIYRRGDPSDNLYILIDGSVDLINPRDPAQPPERLQRRDVFGWRAMVSATPCSYSALAHGKATLWLVPRRAIDALIRESVAFRQKLHRLLRSEEIRSYLQRDIGLEPGQVEQWLGDAVTSLAGRGAIPPALEVQRNREAFHDKLAHMQHVPLLRGLSSVAAEQVSGRLLYKQHPRGTVFYHQHEAAERLFLIEQGEVELFDNRAAAQKPIVLHQGDAFGDFSMITGARHSVTAVAAADTCVWELRKADFDELLAQLPELREQVRVYVRQAGTDGYLVGRQHIDTDNSERWVRQALRNLDAGLPVPAAADLRREIGENRGAPVAIWLGITLDGIPESLVIGASMIHAHLALSLIVGLFLSNYPEALSSSMGMRKQGMTNWRILMMWTSLMLLTGIGAALGSQFFVGASPESFALVEGLAAGAMLTMIAETMLPEAYFKGGSVVGLSTLAGFLIAIFSKTLE
jgi:CRP-like cAMP-binding protein